ncbi:BadF/BadG/BcrA/BcrD ATPase family protein [Oceaniglobus trochenteri]|uniref:BadF/BadG/BcrA/BcrD ATPase family protein n=1 Tax=Oceaniglobus trochenteri TaxID=2763260 RepID=UPI001CFFAAF4|nr:BadF/BadG/BcrA/BcrD ATPase family protein [Oceaniglobus trochenteri]
MTLRHFLGVDGGGSGCRVALTDQSGRVLAQAKGGPANATSDLAGTIANLRSTVTAVLTRADVAESGVAAHMGLAGVLTRETGAQIADAFALGRCRVTDDRPTSLAGAIGTDDGVLMAIGTGAILASRFAGQERYVSGWGLQVSDQASGAWLGRCLLERVLMCHDGLHDHSPLSHAILEDLGGPTGIVAFAARATPASYATLAPRIIDLAEDDANARALLARGAEYLEQVLGVLDPKASGVICLAGGIAPHYANLLPDQARDRLIAARGSALDGALQLARTPAPDPQD